MRGGGRHAYLARNPAGKTLGDRSLGVALVGEDDGGVVGAMADRAANGLIDGLGSGAREQRGVGRGGAGGGSGEEGCRGGAGGGVWRGGGRTTTAVCDGREGATKLAVAPRTDGVMDNASR